MTCLVATGLPFQLLMGYDVLRKYSAIIDLSKEKVSLYAAGIVWIAELTGSDSEYPSGLPFARILLGFPCLLYTSRCV